MPVKIFLQTFKTFSRSLRGWSIAIFIYSLLLTGSFSFLHDLPQVKNVFQGVGNQLSPLETPAEWISAAGFDLILPTLLALFAISWASQFSASQPEKSLLPLLLAAPISRYRLVLEKFGVLMVGCLILGMVSWVSIVIGSLLFDLSLSIANLAQASLILFLQALTFGCLAFTTAMLTGRIWLSRIIGFSFILLSIAEVYSPRFLSGWSYLNYLSPFAGSFDIHPLLNGLQAGSIWALGLTCLVLLGIALEGFERRDITF